MDEEEYSVGSITKLLHREEPGSVNSINRKRKKSASFDEKLTDLFAEKPHSKKKKGEIDCSAEKSAVITIRKHGTKRNSVVTGASGTGAADVRKNKKSFEMEEVQDCKRKSLKPSNVAIATKTSGTVKEDVSALVAASAAAFRHRVQKPVKIDVPVDPAVVAEKLARTVYVGNLPVSVDRRALRRFFKFMLKDADPAAGNIICNRRVESVRLRGAVPADPKTRKKLAVIHREMLHPERQSLCAYVVMSDVEAAKAAVKCCNGVVLADRTLRVDMATPSRTVAGSASRKSVVSADSSRRCVFLGNLSFGVTEEAVRHHFEAADCGRIVNVRVVRDAATGMGRGFGYVEFADEASVQLALRLHLTPLIEKETGKARPMRIHRCLRDRADQEVAKVRDKNATSSRPRSATRNGASNPPPRRRRVHLASNVPLADARRNALTKHVKKRRQAKQQAKLKKKFDDFSPRALASQSKRKNNPPAAAKKKKEKLKKHKTSTIRH